MSSDNGSPAGSPDKSPAGAEPAAAAHAAAASDAASPDAPRSVDGQPATAPTGGPTGPADGQSASAGPADDESLGQRFLHHLWAANTVTVTVLALALAVVIGGVLMVVSDPDVLATYTYFFARPGDALAESWALVSQAYANLFKGSVINPTTVRSWLAGEAEWTAVLRPISETLTYTTPLVFTGLSVALAFRGGLFNIGAQGQAIIGVIVAALAGFLLPLPLVLHVIVAVLAGALGGALWGFFPGFLKARTGAHEVITTIMLNYIALYFLTWIIVQRGVQNPTRPDAISRPVEATAQLPRLLGDGLRVHAGILLAIAATAAVAWLLNRSTFGFELRAVGANPDAARTAGISVTGTYVLLMVVAGGLAGLGGANMVLGSTANALTPLVAAQIGFDGILVALLGRVKPWGVALAALLFGALRAGGNAMQSNSGISLELVTVLQALIVIFIAAPALVKAIFQLRAARAARLQTSMAKGW